jgi:hypothetical protein
MITRSAAAAPIGARPIAGSVPGIIWAATLPDDGPRGGFFGDGEPHPWLAVTEEARFCRLRVIGTRMAQVKPGLYFAAGARSVAL